MAHPQLTRPVVRAPSSETEPRRPCVGSTALELPTRSWWERAVDPVRWEPGHQRLAALPVFAGCTRAEVRVLARAGDECFVPARTVLCRQGRIGYWLFVVTSGSVQLIVGDGGGIGGQAATLGAGSHFGEVAILGFGPQPVTAVVAEDAMVFVLGRRYVLDLVHSMPGFRAGLFPGVDAGTLTSVVRELRAAGTTAWQAMPRRAVDDLLAGDRVEQLPPTLVAVPAKVRLSVGPSPFAAALPLRWGSGGAAAGAPMPVPSLDRRVVAALAVVVALGVVAIACLFRPDVLVVRPSGTIDVSRDVTVAGLAPPTGRYVVTAVDIEETNLVGLAMAVVRGEQTVRRAHGDAAEQDERVGRAAYRRSQRVAAEIVARRAGIEPATMRFRDRRLVGPSAGLLYALVLADMAGVVEVPQGRVVAATGELDDQGRIRPVGFLDAKREVARRSGATVFLVPVSPGASAVDGTVAVATLDEALVAVGS